MATTEAPEKLRLVTKLAYGVGDLGPAIVAGVNGFFLNAFLLDVAGLRPDIVSVIFLLVKIWDAVNDPIIGTLTDRTNTRWGRRRPWLLFGSIPFGLAFFLHWLVPPLGDTGLFIYYLIIAVLLDTAFTAVNIPYASLTPELTHDYDERTSLNSYRFSFSILGGLAAVILHGVLTTGSEDPFFSNALSAAILGVLIVLSNIIVFAFTKETHFQEDRPEEPGFIEGFKIAFANRPFIYVTLIYLLSWLAIQFVQNNILFYVRYWSGGEEQFSLLIIALQIPAFIFLFVWSKVSERIGKKRVYYIGATIWIMALLSLYFIQPGQINLLFGVAVVAGIGVSVGYLIPWSMLPDVIELDELNTGLRREGVYYGFFVFLQKMGISLGVAFSNLILGWSGYINWESGTGAPVPVQPEAVQLALRSFVSFAPAIILLLSLPIVYYYPITREKHAEIEAQIAERRSS